MPDVYYRMTFGHFQLYAEGYRIREARRWEPFRMVIATIHNAAGDSKTPRALFPLYTDNDIYESDQEPVYVMTRDEVLIWINKFDKMKWTSS